VDTHLHVGGHPRRRLVQPSALATLVLASSGRASISSVRGSARFCSIVAPSSSAARRVTTPRRSSERSHSSLSVMSAVRRPNTTTSPASGMSAPLMRLTRISAPPASIPEMATRSPAWSANDRRRSGRSA
jgi:hypothetical protein